MLCLSEFELYSRWVPLSVKQSSLPGLSRRLAPVLKYVILAKFSFCSENGINK